MRPDRFRSHITLDQVTSQFEDTPLAVGEVLKRFLEVLFGQQVRRPIKGRLGLLVGDELAELRLLVVVDQLPVGAKIVGRTGLIVNSRNLCAHKSKASEGLRAKTVATPGCK